MKLKWNGHSCFTLTFDDGTVVITDPFDEKVGYPLCTQRADIVTTSHGHYDHNYTQSLKGEFKVLSSVGTTAEKGLTITGIPSFHDDAQGSKRGANVIFIIEGEGLRIAHMGDLGHTLNAEQTAALKNIDIMLIPIGGFYTIDTPTAVRVLESTVPRCAVAMHFANRYCGFPISDEAEFVRLTGAQMAPNEVTVSAKTALPRAMVMRYGE